MSEARWIVGVDIGGTNLVVGLVPVEGGEAFAVRSCPTEPRRGSEAIVADVARMTGEAVSEALDEYGGSRAAVLGVGVGCPGAVNRAQGIVVQSPNLGWRSLALRGRIQALVDWPVALDNDANCATLGEWWQGAARGYDPLVGIVVGTGIGGGYILDGRLVHGATDGAGEVGHTTINVGGRRCACGNYGCLEAYASGPNIAARAREGLDAGAHSSLRDLVDGNLELITAATVYEAVERGDAYATEVMMETAKMLGAGVANVINLLNPRAVVIMGGVTRAGAHLFDPLRAEVRKRAFRTLADATELLPPGLPGTAGVVGAAGVLKLDLLGNVGA